MAAFYNHKIREHGQLKRMALDSVSPTSSSITPGSKSLAKSHPALKVDTLGPSSNDKPQLATAIPLIDLEMAPTPLTKILSPTSPIMQVLAKKPVNIHCMLCGFGCHDDYELDLHAKNVHEVTCNVCGNVFFTNYDLIVHTATTHEKPYCPASIDGSQVPTPPSLPAPKKQSEDQSNDTRNRVFNLIIEFLISNPHPLYPEAFTDHPLRPADSLHSPLLIKPFSCDYCPSIFQSEARLDTHVVESHHIEMVEQIINFDEFPYNCGVCIYGSNSKVELANHMRKSTT